MVKYQGEPQREPQVCGLTIQVSFFLILSLKEKSEKCKRMPSNAYSVDEHSPGHIILVLSAIRALLL